MSFSRIYAIFVRQVFLFRSNPTRVAVILLWVVIDILMWGFITRYLGTLGAETFNFVSVILGAIIFWDFASRIQLGTMTAFMEDVWSHNFINFFASPLKISEYISGMVLTSLATAIGSISVMSLLAGLLFGYNILKVGFLFLPFLMVLFIFGMAMGIFISSTIFRLGPSAEWLAWPIPLVISIFAGVFYPVSALPSFLQVFARAIPASYVFESMRSILAGLPLSGGLLVNLLIGFGLALIYLVLTYLLFVGVYRRNLKKGAIAHFDVE
jgi:ABC-2 type transport system permease protein